MRNVLWRGVGRRLAAPPARRSFFSSPPLLPVLTPAPVASDAKPFFAGGVESRTSRTAASLSSSSIIDGDVPPETVSSVARDDVDHAKYLSTSESDDMCKNKNNNANTRNNNNNSHLQFTLFSPEALTRHAPKPTKLAASLVADALGISMNTTKTCSGSHSKTVEQKCGGFRQEYSEHCVLGWSPSNLYHVVSDVSQYNAFLPWCLDSSVRHIKRLNDDTLEMIATLTVGFSFFKEQYASRVLLVPDKRVEAVLSEGEKQRRSPVLSDLRCVWELSAVPGFEQRVEVKFVVGFAFTNPLYSKLIMSHVVSLMTRSFEKRCETKFGPPSCQCTRPSTNQEERQK